MTNREWLQNLSDKELAELLTRGLEIKYISMPVACCYSVQEIAGRYTDSSKGLEKWFSTEQEFITIEEWRAS